MNWFLVAINRENEMNNKSKKINEMIVYEYALNVVEMTLEKDGNVFTVASNRKDVVTPLEISGITVAGDISLHNKKQLIEEYYLYDKVQITSTNEELISYLYKRNGTEFIQDLIGEFSFVLYDGEKNTVYAVRDHMGIKTLFWTKFNDGYVFASDIFLLQDYFSLNEINYNYFKEFYLRNGVIDSECTPYQKVMRVPRGSYFKAEKDKNPEVTKYWDLSLVSNSILYKKEYDYIEHFRGILATAVKDRLQKGNSNSVMLSGGLDSTSIFALAKKEETKNDSFNVSSISAVFEELKDSDESEYIKGLLNKYDDQGVFLNCDNVLIFEDFPNKSPFAYEPCVSALTHEFTIHTIKESKNNGFTNILSGYGGDQVLSSSLYMTRDQMKKGKIKTALSIITDHSIRTNTSALQNLSKYVLFPRVSSNYLSPSLMKDNKKIVKTLERIKFYQKKDLYFQVYSANTHYIDRVLGAMTGTDLRHPFLDRRLVEFMYKIPSDINFSTEFNKIILRKAMEDFLTKEILEKTNKTTHLAHTYKSIRENWNNIFEVMKKPKAITELGLIAYSDWMELLNKWRSGAQVKDDFWTLFSIELWFEKYYLKISSA